MAKRRLSREEEKAMFAKGIQPQVKRDRNRKDPALVAKRKESARHRQREVKQIDRRFKEDSELFLSEILHSEGEVVGGDRRTQLDRTAHALKTFGYNNLTESEKQVVNQTLENQLEGEAEALQEMADGVSRNEFTISEMKEAGSRFNRIAHAANALGVKSAVLGKSGNVRFSVMENRFVDDSGVI